MKQLLVFLLLLCSASVSAQDVIVKKDGSTILSKVLEVGQDVVKYKNFSNLDGPTYTISKSELQSINYQNGAKDTFSAPVREENRYLPNNQNDGMQMYNDRALLELDYNLNKPYAKRAKALKTIGWIGGGLFVGAGVVLTGMCLTMEGYSLGGSTGETIAAVACFGVGIGWTLGFHSLARRAQNESYNQYSILQKEIYLNDGTSLSLGADLLRDQVCRKQTVGLGLRYNF